MEEEGVIGNVTIGEYPLYFIPFDEDVLSLELERSFKVQRPPPLTPVISDALGSC